jgi:integrase
MGLGSAIGVPLADAREKATAARHKVARGINPIEERKQHRGIPTFGEMAREVHEAISSGFRNQKHKAQWINTIETYAASLLTKPVDTIDTGDVLAVLKPIWTGKQETAGRLRGRIEKVLAAAKVKGYREGENPARWKEHLDNLLSRPSQTSRGHHAAMPYGAVPTFIEKLQNHGGIAALALEFCILTAARSGEVLGARWTEFDLDEKIWTVPSHRMKAGKEHRVPLCDRAIAILKTLGQLKTSEFVFSGQKPNKPLSNMAMAMVLRRIKLEHVTVHGFRSSFRDWAGDKTDFARELIEEALAHTVGSRVEKAYRRMDALEKRRALMDEWAEYCEQTIHDTPAHLNSVSIGSGVAATGKIDLRS